jgi:homoserine kinase type II
LTPRRGKAILDPVALYTVLTPEQLTDAAAQFGLPRPDRVVPEPKGSVNSNYHLWAGGERYFLRVNEGKSEAEVLFEAEVHAYLHAAQFPAPHLLPTANGRLYADVAGRPALLFAYAPGEELTRDAATPARIRRIGEQLGRLHDLAAGFTGERQNPYGPARVAGWLADFGGDAARDPELAATLPVLADELARADRLPGAPSGLVHGDLFVDNVLWIGDRVSAILDWEMSCVAPFAYDLGVTLNAWCWTGAAYDSARALALIAGYRARRRLEAETADALYAWTCYAALRFTASRIEAFHECSLGADRLAWKDWRSYRDRLVVLRGMGEPAFRALLAT